MALPRVKITLPILVLYVMILLSMQFCVFAVNFSACTRWVKENFFKISITVKHITTRSPWGEGRETHWGKVSGVCQEHFNDVLRVLLGWFKVLSKEFQASLKDVSRVSQTYSKVFQESFMSQLD